MGSHAGYVSNFLIIRMLFELLNCTIRRKYSYICSSHSYNYDVTSGPLGPRQIINFLPG